MQNEKVQTMYLLIFSVCCAFIISAGFLYRYGNIPRQHPLVTLSVLVAWSFSFLIVFTIPLDITAVSSSSHINQSKLTFFLFLDRLSTMLIRSKQHRKQFHSKLPKALGNGVRRCFSQPLENYLLDITVLDMAYHAANAILS